MEEMNRRNDQGLGLLWDYIMLFLFCTDLFYRKRKKAESLRLDLQQFPVFDILQGIPEPELPNRTFHVKVDRNKTVDREKHVC